MKRGRFVAVGLVMLWSATVLAAAKAPPAGKPPAPWKPPASTAAPATAPAQAPRKSPVYVGGVYDTGQFLPDTTVLARVDDRAIRIGRYVDAFFASYAPTRPRPDSLGRVEFLSSMVNKEIMALTALAVGRPPGFEDRVTLRSHTERVLANVLYQRAVLDSVTVTEDDLRRVHAQYGWQAHFRHILMDDVNAAESVRQALLVGRLTWPEAVKRYSVAKDKGEHGDLGWIVRGTLELGTADLIWDLKPGEISPVIQDPNGVHIMRMVERRAVDRPAFEPLRPMLAEQIHQSKSSQRARRLQSQVGARIGLAYDTTNIVWAAAQLKGHEILKEGPTGPILDISGTLPEFQPSDTARVLARHRHGRFSLGDFLGVYNTMSPILRKPVGDFESLRGTIDGMVLEPYMAEEARARGLERDSMAVAAIEQKREELAVEHLYQDSVESRVWIPAEERRKYYDEHIAQYITYGKARFAAIVRGSKAGADSIVTRLAGGEKAADILHADSLAGVTSGSIRERSQADVGPHHTLLFGELRPGQTAVRGPDREGTWMVIQLIEYDPGRQLSYEEAQHYVDESLRNIRAEAMLNALIARHRPRFRIDEHPELVMRVRLVDPTAN